MLTPTRPGRRTAVGSRSTPIAAATIEIFIAGLETGALRQMTDNDVQDFGPTWSSDGEMLAFYRSDDALFEIYSMDLRDESVRQITDFGAYTGNPAFSPDGRNIAFSSNKDGRIYEIYVMDLATGDVRQLTRLSGFAADFIDFGTMPIRKCLAHKVVALVVWLAHAQAVCSTVTRIQSPWISRRTSL
jgi:tricorn protease-like protein